MSGRQVEYLTLNLISFVTCTCAISLRTNIKPLFQNDLYYANIKPLFQNDLYYANSKDPYASASAPLMVPTVRIEASNNFSRRRLSSEFTEVSEYDIPLDKNWEFPRER